MNFENWLIWFISASSRLHKTKHQANHLDLAWPKQLVLESADRPYSATWFTPCCLDVLKPRWCDLVFLPNSYCNGPGRDLKNGKNHEKQVVANDFYHLLYSMSWFTCSLRNTSNVVPPQVSVVYPCWNAAPMCRPPCHLWAWAPWKKSPMRLWRWPRLAALSQG